MPSIVIKEENSHFEHGLEIIISHLTNQWYQEICFLPVEDIDRTNIAFISLGENWLSADRYQIPAYTRRQHRAAIYSRNNKNKLMFQPCLYMLPLIYQGDDVKEMTKKLVLILQERMLCNNMPITIYHHCATRSFSIEERRFLIFLVSGYILAETVHLLSVSEIQAKATHRSIVKRLYVENDQQFLRCIQARLNFLQS